MYKGDKTRSDTQTIIAALRVLRDDIQSEDGVCHAVCAEAADRLEELCEEINTLCQGKK